MPIRKKAITMIDAALGSLTEGAVIQNPSFRLGRQEQNVQDQSDERILSVVTI